MSVLVEPTHLAAREPAPPLPQGELVAEKVPAAHVQQRQPLIRLLMPVVMVSAMAAMIIVIFLTSRNGPGGMVSPMMLVMPLMMLMGFFTMFAPPNGSDTDEQRRTYLRHLGELRETANSHAQAQLEHELHQHPHPADLWALVGGARLWERNADDPDALETRVGTGVTSLCTPIVVEDSGSSEDLDPVCAVALRHVVRATANVADSPISVALASFRFVSVAGVRSADLVRAIVCQLAVHHGPDALSISFSGSWEHNQQWQWMKWLPHTQKRSEAESPAAHRVLVVDSSADAAADRFLDDAAYTLIIDCAGSQPGIMHMIARDEGLALRVADGAVAVVTEDGPETIGQADAITVAVALDCARRLARFTRASENTSVRHDYPALLGIADVEAIDVGPLWNRARPYSQRLRVPLGLNTGQSPLVLDIKESAHGGMGPHGLCIGATGSGKSELLRSFVVGLAATHSPDELNMVLVDFKGGATFLGVEHLPHTSAVITNLEEEADLVARMHDAISGEMNRRQELLRWAGNFANVVDYTAARERGERAPDGTALPPLPALVIVVDEFSELLGQHPDFADLFVAVGRLGRSLQIHLLLASQRLEEGRLRGLDSHLSYRIGLRTFSAAESRQVLGVPDAYTLPTTPGAGYFKAAADEVIGFQAAYVSGPLEKTVLAPDTQTSEVQLFHAWPEEGTQAHTVVDTGQTLLSAVVAAARREAEHRGESAHQIWLPPLPAVLELSAVMSKGATADDEHGFLSAAVGVIDRPYHQRQDPLVVDLSAGSGHIAIAGSPRTGKSQTLRTLATALAVSHSPQQVKFYGLDFSAGELAPLERLPHTAGIANRKDPERVARVIDEVRTLIDDGGEENRHTVLLIDGWHSFSDEHEELAAQIASIAATGPSAGVHLVVTTARWTALRPAIRDLITTRYELRLGEALDSLIDRSAQQRIPAKPGRGITAAQEDILFALTSNQDIAHATRLWESYDPVPQLAVLPEKLSYAALPQSKVASISLGLGGRRLEPVPWTAQHLLAIGARGAGKSTTVRTIARGICSLGRDDARIVLLDPRRTHLGVIPEEMLAGYAATPESIREVLSATVHTLRERLPGAEITPEELADRSWWEGPEIYVLVDDAELIDDSAFHELAKLIPHSPDVGVHLVFARAATGIGRAAYQPLLTALKAQLPAVLLMDSDKEEGTVFGMKPRRFVPGRGQYDSGGDYVGVIHVASAVEVESDAGV